MGAAALLQVIGEAARSAGYEVVAEDKSDSTENALPPDMIFVREDGGALFSIAIEQVI